jgi:hypothetical protein
MYVHKDGVALEWKFWQKSILYPSQRGLHGLSRYPPVIFITKTLRISVTIRWIITVGGLVIYSNHSLMVTLVWVGSLGSIRHLVWRSVDSVPTVGDDSERISWRLCIGPWLHVVFSISDSSVCEVPMSLAKIVDGWHWIVVCMISVQVYHHITEFAEFEVNQHC